MLSFMLCYEDIMSRWEHKVGAHVRCSKHAVKRMRERLGLNKRGAERELDRALKGLHVDECNGKLRKWLENIRENHGGTAHYRVTPTAVYVFQANVLVTVMLVPQEHAKRALDLWLKLR